MDNVKIIGIELENVKRVALVRMAPAANGITVIGGDNAAGKTSVLDGIVYALGGEKYRPSNLKRDGALADARIRIELSNGMIVERKGKNAALKVSDPSGRRSGQKLLDEFVEELALNLPKFLAMRDDEKAEVLLRTLGIGEQLAALDRKEQAAYDKRHAFGVVVDQKVKYAREMPEYHDVPDVPLSAADLIRESQDILNRNTERDRLRSNLAALKRSQGEAADRVARLREELERAEAEALKIGEQVTAALAEPIPENESTAELEAKIADIDTINAKIRANSDKEKAQADADDYKRQLDQLTAELEAVREERRKLLDTAEMPLDELAIGRNDKGRPILLFNNQPWDCMSGMERIRTAVAVVRKLKPACGFVLIDAIEAFDLEQLRELDRYLEEHHLQAIATRVSRGDECSIIIEDGVAVQPGTEAAPEVPENNTANNMGEW